MTGTLSEYNFVEGDRMRFSRSNITAVDYVNQQQIVQSARLARPYRTATTSFADGHSRRHTLSTAKERILQIKPKLVARQ